MATDRKYPRTLLSPIALSLIMALAALAAWLALAPYKIMAAGITVDTQLDDNAVNGNCTLREAIIAANTDAVVDQCPAGSGADTITLPAGTYFLTVAGANEDAGATGDLDITDDLTIIGAGQDNTFIDGGGLDRVLDIRAATTASISDLTILGGRSNDNGGGVRNAGALVLTRSTISDNSASGFGGGIYNPGSLELTDSTISGNDSFEGGGGIFNSGAMTLTNSTVSDNFDRSLGGGGIFSSGANASVTITSSTVSGNRVSGSGGTGGGIHASAGATVSLVASIVSGNSTDFRGGGIAANDATVTLANSAISGNNAVHGGGIANDIGELTITDTTISGNSADFQGGGIGAGRATVILANSTISGNSAAVRGGGIFVADGAMVTVTNSTVSGNSADDSNPSLPGNGQGGGIYTTASTVTLISTTISGNIADDRGGGGILIDSGTVTLRNTIVANNLVFPGQHVLTSPDCSGVISSSSYSLDSDGSCHLSGTGDLSGVNPRLGTLRDNGGPTLTRALLPGSPAINAIPIVNCVDADGNPLAADQRGVARPQGSGCDMGAYEVVIPLAKQADLSVTKVDMVNLVTVGDPVNYTVTVTNHGPDTARSVVMTDTLPAGVNFVSASPAQGDCSESGGTVTCNLGDIANGSAVGTVVVITADAVGTITNRVNVTASTSDPKTSNNAASDDTEITDSPTPKADLAVSITDSPDPVAIGSTVAYTVTVTNNGPDTAPGVMVTNTLPASGATFISATPDQGMCFPPNGGIFICNLNSLANSASVNIAIVVTTTSIGTISNEAVATSSVADPGSGNNSDSADTTVRPVEADLSLTKASAPDPVTAGDQLTYTLTVTNNGVSDATGVVLTDNLPAGVAFQSASQGCIYDQDLHQVVCDIGSLARDDSVMVEIVVTVNALPGATLTNTSEASGDQDDPNLENNTTETSTKVHAALGDLNCDGAVNIFDVILLLQVITGLTTLPECGALLL